MIQRILGVVLLAAGVLILVYRGFSVPKEHEGKLGPIQVRMTEHERVELPTWLGVVSAIAGGGLLLWSGRRK
jgi:hypothetical protein